MAETGTNVTAIQQSHPVTRWFVGLGNLANETLLLFNPVICTALSCFGGSVTTCSPKFRSLSLLLQMILTFLLTGYVAFTAVVTFGTWTTRRVLNLAIPPHPLLIYVQHVISVSFLLWMWSVTLTADEYLLGLGIGTLVVQAQYLARLQGYDIQINAIITGLICLAGMTVYHECDNRWGSYISLIGAGGAIAAMRRR